MTIHRPLAFLVLLTMLVIGAGQCHADEWMVGDTKREIAWQVINVVDAGQTLDISKRCGEKYELNPILGRCPDSKVIAQYFATAAMLHFGVSLALPRRYRAKWQIGTIVVSGAIVLNNYSIGLKINF